jgi:hypothetical protein
MADRYFVNGGVDSLYGSSSNWSTTDGGAGGAGVPGGADDIKFTANSPNCNLATTPRSALTANFTGYTNNLDIAVNLSISGNITLSPTMTTSGAAALIASSTGTLTSNGKIFTTPFQIQGSGQTYTLADDWTISGPLTMGTGGNVVTINGNNIYAQGDVNFGTTTGNITGTTVLNVVGTGTITSSHTSGRLSLNTIFNTTGAITFASGTFGFSTGTLTYTPNTGTVNATAANLLLSQANTTLACDGLTWNNATISGAFTTTFSEDLNVGGTLTIGSTSASTVLNGSEINCHGNIRFNGTTGNVSGTTVINALETATIDAPSTTTGRILSTLVIDAGSDTVTFDGPIYWDMAKVQYESGTVITDAGTWATGGTGSPIYVINSIRNVFIGDANGP